MKVRKGDFGIIFWVHLVFIVFTYLTPFLFNYWLVIGGVVLLQLQYLILGGCFLTRVELGGGKYYSFYYHYLKKIFPNIPKKPLWIFSTYILSVLGVIVSVVWQVVLGKSPVIF